MRKGSGYIGRKMLKMERPDRRQRGRRKVKFVDDVREDMQIVGVREDARNRERWTTMIRCRDT